MKKSMLAIVVMALSPVSAFAQSADTSYCNALSALFDRYVNNPSVGNGSKPADPKVTTAEGQCAKNPAAGIPVLEQALKASRVSLPARP